MRKVKLSSVLAMVLSAFMLITSLPMAAFAVTPTIGTGAGTPNYDDYRGNGMTADAKGVMIYDDLAKYYKKSQKDVLLSTEYTTKVADKSGSKTRDFYPDLYADFAIYYDESIEGTTVIIEQGLSEIDFVQYVDAEGNMTTGEAPSVLTASNGGDATYGAGYGVNDEGKTTRYYAEKSIMFYIINHNCSERIGQEDDVSILSDYIAQGYVVVTVDYKDHEDACSPNIEQSLVSARAMFADYTSGSLVGLGVVTSPDYIYFIPEGCRLARDIWFWDSSIWGVNGIMEYYRTTIWNSKIAGNTEYDPLNIGTVDSVDEMITTILQKDGETPIDYKLSLNIIYPSDPLYEVPLMVHEGTNYIKERNYLRSNSGGTFTGFALNGYACVQYDHPFFPFLYRDAYKFSGSGSLYGTQAQSTPYVARAAMRCARYYADTFGYSSTLAGAAGISKGSRGAAVLSVVNNKQITVGSLLSWPVGCCEGDIFTDLPEGVTEKDHETTANRVKEIVQPFMYYDDGEEISSEINVAYVSSGEGANALYGTGAYVQYGEVVPSVYSCGTRDEYKCWNHWLPIVEHVTEKYENNTLLIPMMDQGHAYPFGYDEQYGYERFIAMLDFFDLYLRPEENKAPEVLWMTPLTGEIIPASGTWNNGPWTPYGWATDSYYQQQNIQVKFLDSVNPESVNVGVEVRDASGKRIDGEWEASLGNTLFTFVCDGLCAGTTYTVSVTDAVESLDGVALAEEKSVSFRTEGSYALRPVADAYVVADEGDALYDDEDVLIVDNKHIALLTYPTASITGATSISLNFEAICEEQIGLAIYALSDYSIKDASVTYNSLTASDAWKNKITVTETASADSGFITLDLSSLANKALGKYVTLALVSTDKISDKPYSLKQNFDQYTIGTEYTVTDSSGNKVTQVNNEGEVACGNGNFNIPYSEVYIYKVRGAFTNAYLDDTVVESGNALRVMMSGTHFIRFYNSLGTGYITKDDIGKVYRVSVKVMPSVTGTIKCGFASARKNGADVEGELYPNGIVDGFSGTYYTAEDVEEGTWTEFSFCVKITEEMVNKQAVMLTINPPKYSPPNYTWIDDIVIEECSPAMTVVADETDSSGRFTLVTTNTSDVTFEEGELEEDEAWVNQNTPAVVNVAPASGTQGVKVTDSVTVTFDRTMDASTIEKGMIVTNESDGVRISGTWTATDESNCEFVFTTGGFVAGAQYSVKTGGLVESSLGYPCDNQEITRFTVEGSYALRPLATTSVSKSEPNKHFGLDTAPVISEDTYGIVTFSTKSLVSATSAKLRLVAEAPHGTTVTVYAITDYKANDSLCYNTLPQLTDSMKLGTYEVVNGEIGLDVSALAGKSLGDAVTLVFVSAPYVYHQDFENYVIGSSLKVTNKAGVSITYSSKSDDKILQADGTTKTYKALRLQQANPDISGTSAKFSGEYERFEESTVDGKTIYKYYVPNDIYSNFLFTKSGSMTGCYVVDTENSTVGGSQSFRINPTNGTSNYVKLFNTFKTSNFTEADIGKTYNVSFRVKTVHKNSSDNTINDVGAAITFGLRSATVGNGAQISTKTVGSVTGTTYATGAASSYNGTYYNAPCTFNSSTGNTNSITTVAGEWSTVSFTVTVDQKMVDQQVGLLTIQSAHSSTANRTHIDDILVTEVASTVTFAKDSFILVTENEDSVNVTEADKPVVDAVYAAGSKITGAEVALGSSITVNYYVSLAKTHAGAQMKFTFGGKEVVVDGVRYGKEYVYSFTGIGPQAMGENIKAELVLDGEVIASKDEYSVAQNLKRLLAKSADELGLSEAKYGAMKTLIAALLAYGAASQIYTGHNTDALVNAGVESSSTFVALGDGWNRVPSVSTSKNVGLTGASLYFTSTNRLYFRFEANGITEDNFVVRIGDTEYTLSDFGPEASSYVVFTGDIAATEFDTFYTIELVENGEVVQTMEYSVFSYVYAMQNSENQAMANLAKATYNYGVAADAYAIAR